MRLVWAGTVVIAACSPYAAETSPEVTDAGGVAVADGSADAAIDVDVDASTAARSPYEIAVLADKPVAYWRMNVAPGTNLVRDQIATNDLALHAGFQSTSGALGAASDDGAIEFDGTTGYGNATDSRAFDFPNDVPFTVELWAKRIDIDGGSGFHPFVSNIDDNLVDGYTFYAYVAASGTPGTWAEFHPSGGAFVTDLVRAGDWAHYAFVYDGAVCSIVVDGALATKKAVTPGMSARTSTFFVAHGGMPTLFRGALDEIAIYDRALALDRINAHIQAAK